MLSSIQPLQPFQFVAPLKGGPCSLLSRQPHPAYHALPSSRQEDEETSTSNNTNIKPGPKLKADVSQALSRVITRTLEASRGRNNDADADNQGVKKWRPSPSIFHSRPKEVQKAQQPAAKIESQISDSYRPRPSSRSPPSPSKNLLNVPDSVRDSIIIVEGWTDANNIQSALDVDVFVCNGDRVKSFAGEFDLMSLSSLGRDLIILTDPDREGRDLRCFLDTQLSNLLSCDSPLSTSSQLNSQDKAGKAQSRVGSIRHAFVPSDSATSRVGDLRHEAGNKGIEHADPGSILTAITEAAPSFGPSREVFTADFLRDLGLMNSFDAKSTDGAKMRRDRLCDGLGLGTSTGGVLVKMLNRFFTMEKVVQVQERVNP